MNTMRYRKYISHGIQFLTRKPSNLAKNEKIKEKICLHMKSDAMFQIPINFEKSLKTRGSMNPKSLHKELVFDFEDTFEIMHEFALAKSDVHNQDLLAENASRTETHDGEKTRDYELVMFLINCSKIQKASHTLPENLPIKSAAPDDPVFAELKGSGLHLVYNVNIRSHSPEHCGHDHHHISYEETWILELSVLFLILNLCLFAAWAVPAWKIWEAATEDPDKFNMPVMWLATPM
jgi:hypothetical protein